MSGSARESKLGCRCGFHVTLLEASLGRFEPRTNRCSFAPMKRDLLFLIAMLAGCAAPPATSPRREAAELAGRTAGPPQQCIPIVRTEALRASETDQHVLLYGRGRTIWANDLGPGCGFSPNNTLITHPISRYCRGDVVRSFDPVGRIPGQSCLLGDFIPYTR